MQGLGVGLFALLQALLSLLALLLQCATLPLFLLHSDYRSRTSFQMMLSVGLLDSVQLVPIFIGTVCLCVGLAMPTFLDKLLSSLYILGWDALIVQHFLLSLNRAIAIIRPYFWPAAKESTTERLLFRLLNTLLWMALFGIVCLFQTPLLGAKMDRERAVMDYDYALPYSQTYQRFEFAFTIALPALSFCAYLAILVILRKSRESSQQTSSTGTGNFAKKAKSPLMSRQERYVLLQAGILFTGMLVIVVAWNFFAQMDQLGQQLFVIALICYCGTNPVLYLVMNNEFRQRFLKLWHLRRVHEQPKTNNVKNFVQVKPFN